jgi:hypothetical protein
MAIKILERGNRATGSMLLRFYSMLKNSTGMKRDTSSAKFKVNFLPLFLRCYQMSLLVIARELWHMNQERLELRQGCKIDQKWLQCLGCLMRCHPITVTVSL